MCELKSKNARQMQEILGQFGCDSRVVEMDVPTRTVEEAARAIGCDVGQIAKSLVFMRKGSKQPVLIIASGENRVNEKRMKTHLGEKLEKADAEFILEHTGYVIGGIPPVGHRNPIDTFIDEDLLQYEEIWAAAGAPNAVFCVSPNALLKMTGGNVVCVK
jgi:prolyl-tRNA editing enzyme YbaK/EbsC (Cys-tRNA(Pro) deacylase)